MQPEFSSTATSTPMVSELKLERKVQYRGTSHVFSKDENLSWVFKVALSAELSLTVPETHLRRMNIAY